MRIESEGIARVDSAHVERLSRHKLRPGDIVYSRRGDVEKCALVSQGQAGWLCGTGCLLVRIDGPTVDARCLAYALSLPETRAWISQHAVGATMPNLNTNVLREVPVRLPPIEEQRAIAATLGALDDNIEANQRKLGILDELLQAHWVQASRKAERNIRLADIVSTQYGLTASAEAGAVGPKFLRVTDINKQNWISWASVPHVTIENADLEKYQLRQGDIVVARMADPGKSAIVDDAAVQAVFASYLVRLTARSYAEALYIYGFLESSSYRDYAEAVTTGSVQKNMNAKVIVDVEMPWPALEVVHEFARCATELRSAINHSIRQNDRLRAVRDALLPELLSGRLRVPEGEAEVGYHAAEEQENA
ncbi:restriction endonuclease subunit S [Nocardioides pakistanensis]